MTYFSEFVPIDGTPIHVVSWGKGRPIVLIHGLTNSWEGHIPIATHLSHTYRVIIPDLPGYGDSGRLPWYTIETMALYLSKLLRGIHVHPIAIAGLSMGGLVAAEFARAYPKQTKTAVIMGPLLNDKHRGINAAKYFFGFVSFIPGGRWMLKKIVDTGWIAYFFAKYVNMYRFDKHLIDRYGMRGKKMMSKDAYVEMGISAAEYDLEKTLLGLLIPTLLVYGSHDKMSRPSYARQVIGGKSHLRLAVIEKAGHIVSLEKSQETARAMTKFLQSLGPGQHRRQAS